MDDVLEGGGMSERERERERNIHQFKEINKSGGK